MAQSGHSNRADECLLLGEKRTFASRYSPIFDDAREAASLTWCGVWVTPITSVGVFGRVVQRSYSAVAGLSSIAPSFVCSTHNRRYRYQQWAIRYNSRRTAHRNVDS
jgi:hypothetical protein